MDKIICFDLSLIELDIEKKKLSLSEIVAQNNNTEKSLLPEQIHQDVQLKKIKVELKEVMKIRDFLITISSKYHANTPANLATPVNLQEFLLTTIKDEGGCTVKYLTSKYVELTGNSKDASSVLISKMLRFLRLNGIMEYVKSRVGPRVWIYQGDSSDSNESLKITTVTEFITKIVEENGPVTLKFLVDKHCQWSKLEEDLSTKRILNGIVKLKSKHVLIDYTNKEGVYVWGRKNVLDIADLKLTCNEFIIKTMKENGPSEAMFLIDRYSEFAGLTKKVSRARVSKTLSILKSKGNVLHNRSGKKRGLWMLPEN